MKTTKKHQVIMLPTEDNNPKVIFKNTDNRLYPPKDKIYERGLYNGYSRYYFYILSDEEIKEGDWCMRGTHIYRIKNEDDIEAINNLNGKKIIATTDTSLKTNKHLFTGFCGEEYYELLSQISQDFIEYFIKEYNKGNIIIEVNVEYEYIPYLKNGNNNGILQPKINSKDNTISILPVKTNYTLEETRKMCKEAFMAGGISGYNSARGLDFQSVDDWLDENII